MKKRVALMLCAALLVVSALGNAQTPYGYVWEADIANEPYFVFENVSLMDAARECCLIFQGSVYLQDIDIQTVGCSVIASETSDDLITLSLYVVPGEFVVSSGTPRWLWEPGFGRPVRIILREIGENRYELVSYATPEDGMNNGLSQAWIFGEAIDEKIRASQALYRDEARADAEQMAENYLLYKAGGEKQGVWREYLSSGSNPNAATIVETSVYIRHPTYPGTWCWLEEGRRCTLSIEGEQSYSGVLTYLQEDVKTQTILHHFTVQVQGDRLVVLEGVLPELGGE